MMRPTIVITAGVTWHGATARPQHFARGLAQRGWNVLFVNAPISWLSPLKNKSLRSQLLPRNPVTTINDPTFTGQLRVLSPVAGLPFANMYRTVNKWNQSVLAQQIRGAMPGPYILFPMLPGSVDLIPHLTPVVTVYDCVDFHTEFEGLVNPTVVGNMEREIACHSRLVFATSDKLKSRMDEFHSDVRLLPNAAEVDHFAKTQSAHVHPALADIPGPRVGFIGGIGSWIDQEFIAGLAQARPNVHIVLIGPVETNVATLERCPNVHFLGLRPYQELPQFLAGFDATLMVFRNNELSQAVNPIKVYEYLAAGKEVISTPMYEVVTKMKDLVWVAGTPDEGARALDQILAGGRRVDDATRQAFLDRNSWASRVAEVDATLRSLLPMKCQV
jgi:glycosyltransferase involved in cell wall biosynthesis